MKHSYLKKLLFACILLPLFSCLVFSGCRNDNSDANAEIIKSCGNEVFSISSENSGTAANGTILIYEKEKDLLGIKIMLFVSVGAADWGGVAFYLPNGCNLDNIVYDYPHNENSGRGELPVEVWATESDHEEFCTAIEIGRSRAFQPTGGGDGALIIDASYRCDSTKDMRVLKFAAECGVSQKNGNIIWGIEHCDILVDID